MAHLSAVPEPARRLINASQTNGLAWMVYREVDDFLFIVTPLAGDPQQGGDPLPPTLHTSPADYKNAPQAERAAKAWCEAYVPAAPSKPGTGRNLGSLVRTLEAGGWLIEICEDGRGGFVALAIDVDNGEASDEDLGSFETCDLADEAARTWTSKNPTRGERERERTSREMDEAMEQPPFDELAPGKISMPAGPGEANDAAPPTPAPGAQPDELTTLRARLAATEARLAAALERAPEEDAAEYLELATREAELETQITGTKEILAGLKAELTRVRRSMTKKAVAAMERISGRAPVEQLSIGGVLGTARETGMEIAGHRIELGDGTAYTIEHSIEQSPMGELVTTWVTGAREQTIAYATTYERAAEDTKRRALEHFADQPAGARVPPVKSTAPKLRGHDKTAVETAVGRTESTTLAALQLGCTPQQLEKYAAAQGVTLKVPALPEAPVEKAGKPRGRRKAGAK